MGSIAAQLVSGQVSPDMLRLGQVRALAGLSRTYRDVSRSHSCVVLAVCLQSLSCWKVNQSSALWSRFSSRISLYFAQFIFSSIPISLPVSATEKHPHNMMLPPPCFTVEMVPGFLQTWRLAFRPKCYILVSSDQIILFLMVWESLGAFWQTPSGLSCVFHWGVASVWPLYHKGLIGGVLQRWLSFWKVLPSPQRNSRAQLEWPSGSLSPPWPRPFSTDCSVWPGGQL
jgi:hypothetical protein